MDEEIRALAKLHGYAELTDEQVGYLRNKIAAAHVDGLLDRPMAKPESVTKSG